MTPKYKPSDRVRIKLLEEVKDLPNWHSKLMKYAGTEQTISFVTRNDNYWLEGAGALVFTPSMIEGLAEEAKPIRVRVDKCSGPYWYGILIGKEFDVHQSRISIDWWYVQAGDHRILKSDCTILPTKDEYDIPEELVKQKRAPITPESLEQDRIDMLPKDEGKDVPPGVVAVKCSKMGTIWYAAKSEMKYDYWVKQHLDIGKDTIHTIRDSNGVEWSVCEEAKMGYDSFRIDSFRWLDESNTWGVYVTDLDPEYPVQPGEMWLSNLSKLPPPKQQPDLVDKERLDWNWIQRAWLLGYFNGDHGDVDIVEKIAGGDMKEKWDRCKKFLIELGFKTHQP